MMRLAPFMTPGMPMQSPFGFQGPLGFPGQPQKIPGTFNPPPMGLGLGGMGKPRKPGLANLGVGGLGGAAGGFAQRAMF